MITYCLCLCPSSCSHFVPGVLEALPGGVGVRLGHCGVPGAGKGASPRIWGQVYLREEKSYNWGKTKLFFVCYSLKQSSLFVNRCHVRKRKCLVCTLWLQFSVYVLNDLGEWKSAIHILRTVRSGVNRNWDGLILGNVNKYFHATYFLCRKK